MKAYLNRAVHLGTLSVVSSALMMAGAREAGAKPPVPFPHPLITEVLYAVPTGDEGDANQDGQRSATGDEFVELYNPHDRAIQLKGYTIRDGTPEEAYDKNGSGGKGTNGKSRGNSNANNKNKPNSKGESKSDKEPDEKNGSGKKDDRKTSLKFVFPDFELKPGEVVVVFNGFEQKIPGPVGTHDKAPTAKNEKFGNAWVFSMEVKSHYVAFANKGDCVAVYDAEGTPIEAVTWGTSSKETPSAALLTEKAPESKGSVQRAGLTGKLEEHDKMRWSAKGGRELFSPGVFDPSFTPVPLGAGVKDAGDAKKPARGKSPAGTESDSSKEKKK